MGIGIPLPVLTDVHGRRMRKLRVQLTDVCNFRCTYCMPLDVRFQPPSTLLPPDTLVDMVEGLVETGITEVRLTGGEPLVRKEFREIVEGIEALPLEKLGLTTNGHLLARHLPFLAETKCRHINVSLDSLRPERFKAITRTPFFDQVLGSVLEAREMGFPVKINVVLIRGTNDDEVEDFAAFSGEAAELAAGSDFLRTAFGADVVEHYVHAARWEISEHDRVVTDWEVQRGLERA